MDGRSDFVAIDFGTSNSAVALPAGQAGEGAGGAPGGVRLLALEDGAPTMPTAVFYRADTPASQPEAERLDAAKKAKERIDKGESFAKVHEELLGFAPAAPQSFTGQQLAQNPELAILADEKKGALAEPFVENGVPVLYLLADKQDNLPKDFEANKETYLQQERQSLAGAELQKRVDAAVKSSAVEWQDKSLKLVYDTFKALQATDLKLEDLRAIITAADELAGPDNRDPRYTAVAKYVAYDALANRANLRALTGHVDTAIDDYTRVLTIPGLAPGQAGAAHVNRAWLYLSTGNLAAAAADVQAAERLGVQVPADLRRAVAAAAPR
jgi:hypothetical protein